MDPTETAEVVMRRHQPSSLWAKIGLNRCCQGCGRWPCFHWHIARDRRDRVAMDHAAMERIAAVVEELRGLPMNRERTR